MIVVTIERSCRGSGERHRPLPHRSLSSPRRLKPATGPSCSSPGTEADERLPGTKGGVLAEECLNRRTLSVPVLIRTTPSLVRKSQGTRTGRSRNPDVHFRRTRGDLPEVRQRQLHAPLLSMPSIPSKTAAEVPFPARSRRRLAHTLQRGLVGRRGLRHAGGHDIARLGG